MRFTDYQRAGIDIKTLPISRLRAIDIQTVDEEKEVARIIAERGEPVPQERVHIGDIKARMDKDITQRTLTKEKELEYQKEVDERTAKATLKEAPVEVVPEGSVEGLIVPIEGSVGGLVVPLSQTEIVETPPIKVEVKEVKLETKFKKLKKK